MPESKFNIDDLSKEYKSKISKMDIRPQFEADFAQLLAADLQAPGLV